VRHARDPAGEFHPDSLAGFRGTYVYRRGKVRREGYREIREKNGGEEDKWRGQKRRRMKGRKERGGVCLATFKDLPTPLSFRAIVGYISASCPTLF